MKTYLVPVVVIGMAVMGSCKKDQMPTQAVESNSFPPRKVQFELYTDENFAGNQENIQFSLQMRRAEKLLFDSSLATIKIEDIPDFAHRIIIEKWVPGNDNDSLTVGFNYTIENVGTSWYFEKYETNDTFKLVRYDFR